MNLPPDHNKLLDDVLAEAVPPDHRVRLLQATLHLARRRRQFRRARQIYLVLIAACLLALWFTPKQNPPAHPQPAPLAHKPEFSLNIVRTQPLPASALISSQPLNSDSLIATSPGHFRFIGDEELLALAGPAPVALVRCGRDCAELVFANPADQQRLLFK